MALMKLCRCGKMIDITLSRCDHCQDSHKERHKLYDKTKRDERSSAFYKSKEWRRLRKKVIARDNGLCQRCLKSSKFKAGEICHHIIEIKEDWGKRLDESNIEFVCMQCHNQIHGNTPHL
jgi:5-methylcytosine-specific restriction protein A